METHGQHSEKKLVAVGEGLHDVTAIEMDSGTIDTCSQ